MISSNTHRRYEIDVFKGVHAKTWNPLDESIRNLGVIHEDAHMK